MRSVRIPFVIVLLYTTPSVSLSVMRDNTILIVFSERVVNFTEDSIDITGGTLNDFRGNGREFLVEVQTDGTAKIHVPESACQSANGIPNTASNRLVYEG